MNTETTTSQPESDCVLSADMLNGVKEIAGFLGFAERRTFHLCATGQLPGVFKIGRCWHARKSSLLQAVQRMERGVA